MYKFSNWLSNPIGQTEHFDVDNKKVKTVFDNVIQQQRTNLIEEEGYKILNAYGFPIPRSILATSESQSIQAAQEIGFPVVMKIASPDIIHKSDVGGVRVGLKTNDEIKAAFRTIMDNAKKTNPMAKINGILIQEMVKSGKEIILGAKRDPLFGPLLMFGLGGIYVILTKY